MQVYTELLPPTKSAPRSGIRWTPVGPGTGLLIIEKPRVMATYAVREFQTPWPGRAFRFDCRGGQTDAEGAADGYDVFVPHRGTEWRCDCKGFSYGKGRPCKHVEAVRAILANGWMDSPVNPDADTGRTEVDDQPEQF
ncbi:SWIM zinc finger family protein [Gemmata sp.]|uniref:SWIM zinc finger family protein n=1 Tax=Gemmata sp. TaxID=1914242 RepID=UPI003F72F036